MTHSLKGEMQLHLPFFVVWFTLLAMDRLYGRHAVHECLRARRRLASKLLLAEGTQDAPIIRDIVALAKAQNVPQIQARREFFDQISTHAQGVALEVGEYPYVDLGEMFARAAERQEKPFLLMLDSLQDPQNFGNLIRTAEAVGVHGIIISERRSAAVTPSVVNTSAGAVEHMLIARVVNLARTVDELKKRDVWIAALQSDPRAQEIYKADLKGAFALIVGSESEGISRLLRDKADFLIRLPMRGQIESLNASVAGAVALYEMWRQR